MFEKILVPLDGSEFAEAALPYAEVIGRAFESELMLLHVCTPDCRTLEGRNETYLNSLAESWSHTPDSVNLQNTKLSVTAKIEKGNPLEVIVEFVEENKIELVVMTGSGTTGHKIGKLGSVADHITRTLKIPVMLIKTRNAPQTKNERPSLKRILVPLDGSNLSKLALPTAFGLADKLQIPLTLFQMVRVVYPYSGEAAPFVDYEKISANDERKVRVEMSALEQELKNKGHIIEWEVKSGTDPADEIIKFSQKIGSCLVIMSTHGLSGISRWALGSVAERVLHHIEAPLLLVPARAGNSH
jgi:nucleotide-binding universal stress UspA family protein